MPALDEGGEGLEVDAVIVARSLRLQIDHLDWAIELRGRDELELFRHTGALRG